MTAALNVSGLSFAYRDSLVLREVTLDLPQGVVMGIVGPNGAGKSTLLKAVVGLLKPTRGTVSCFGQPLPKVRRRVGYMRQASSVDWDFPTTVSDVVLMGTYGGLGWFRRPGAKERDVAAAALRRVGIPHLAHRPINQLSGGERQRTFLARLLAQQSDLLLLDEPFAGVDAASQETITNVLHGLRDAGRTVVIVHHDLATVPTLCDWTCLLNRTVMGFGPTEEVFTDEAVKQAYGLATT
ncbi:metal ABC transporter ATP-binding protein [[Pseudopropionibacterium] massiliense]|uniref:metal ABC transporter ATP-binding protein n=1 Tax=[Pseudopropionibacterium] massiliense TaxID=2220000 RepID=UPI001031F5CC|nr:metal ABC transporter ATP-binding protein [[Pseudopropionibacterium] massiliense]